jgi:hypothetical protein
MAVCVSDWGVLNYYSTLATAGADWYASMSDTYGGKGAMCVNQHTLDEHVLPFCVAQSVCATISIHSTPAFFPATITCWNGGAPCVTDANVLVHALSNSRVRYPSVHNVRTVSTGTKPKPSCR